MISSKIAIVLLENFFRWDLFWYLTNGITYGTTSIAGLKPISGSKRVVNHIDLTIEDEDLEHPVIIKC